MDSGIYIYTFANGDNYVGQAVDIEKRWDQHITKMEKGQHTRLIQDAYNKYGLPRFRVLLKCHPNYLDAMEAWCIKRVAPRLNTTIPVCYDDTPATFEITGDMLQVQIFKNLYNLHSATKDLEAMEEAATTLSKKLEHTKKRVIQVAREAQPKELKDYIVNVETKLTRAEHDLRETTAQLRHEEAKIHSYRQLPWYKRIFQTI